MIAQRAQCGLMICLILAASPAAAADGSGFSLLGSFFQMLASLAIVVGLILLFSHFANRWLKNGTGSGITKYIRILETRHIGPKKSLMLVEIGGEYLLIGNSAEGVQLIKQVDMLEEIEVLGAADSAWRQATPLESLRGLLSKVPRDIFRPVAARKSC